MQGLIPVSDPLLRRYEELLLRRNELRKACLHLAEEYTRVFGPLMLEVFRLKLECAKKKKAIGFCQQAVNRGRLPDEKELKDFILRETEAMQRHLAEMAEECERAKNFTVITEADAARIRVIYRKLARKLHPDMNPAVEHAPALRELWLKTLSAYNRNDLQELQELEALAARALSETGGETIPLRIEGLEEKITGLEKEIRGILDTDPYQYKFLLEDGEAVAERKRALAEEKSAWEEYSAQLDEVMASVLPEGVIMIWDLN